MRATLAGVCALELCSLRFTINTKFMCIGLITVNSEIFARILFSRIMLKDIFVTLEGLPTSVNERVILPFREGYIFRKLHENFRIHSMYISVIRVRTR